MTATLSIVVLAAELLISALGAFVSIAALGFAGEVTRSRDLTAFGWVLGALYFVVTFTPLVATAWVAHRRFVSDKAFPVLEVISSPYLVPVVLWVGAGPSMQGQMDVMLALGWFQNPTVAIS